MQSRAGARDSASGIRKKGHIPTIQLNHRHQLFFSFKIRATCSMPGACQCFQQRRLSGTLIAAKKGAGTFRDLASVAVGKPPSIDMAAKLCMSALMFESAGCKTQGALPTCIRASGPESYGCQHFVDIISRAWRTSAHQLKCNLKGCQRNSFVFCWGEGAMRSSLVGFPLHHFAAGLN